MITFYFNNSPLTPRASYGGEKIVHNKPALFLTKLLSTMSHSTTTGSLKKQTLDIIKLTLSLRCCFTVLGSDTESCELYYCSVYRLDICKNVALHNTPKAYGSSTFYAILAMNVSVSLLEIKSTQLNFQSDNNYSQQKGITLRVV